MSTNDTIAQLQDLIRKLQAKRQSHVDAIEQIDRTFVDLGLGDQPEVPQPRTRKTRTKSATRKAKTSGRRTRGRFTISGEDSVYQFVQSHGNPTTAEVNEHWQAEGRKGKADNALTKLVKDKRLKRIKKQGQRGSSYRVA